MKGEKKPLQGLSIRDEENKRFKVKKQNQTNQKTRCKRLLRLCPFPLLQVLWLRQGLPPLNSPDNFTFWAPPLWTRASCVFQSSWRAWQANSTDRSVPERLYVRAAEAKAEACSSSRTCWSTGSLASSEATTGYTKGRMGTRVSHQYVRPCSHRYLSIPPSRWMLPGMICLSSSWSSPSGPAVASPTRMVPLGLSWGWGHCQSRNRPSAPTARLPRRPPQTGTTRPPPPPLQLQNKLLNSAVMAGQRFFSSRDALSNGPSSQEVFETVVRGAREMPLSVAT